MSDGSGAYLCVFLIAAIIILMFWQADRTQKRRKKELAIALALYKNALGELKSNPSNADLHQKTLWLGRQYSDLTRDKKGVTLFDEVALMNDISAATASGAVSIAKEFPQVEEKQSVEDRLTKLSELRLKGLINEQEYSERRQKILDEL